MKDIMFESVYLDTAKSIPILYDLLQERTPEQSISHVEMPHIEEHIRFVMSKPYFAWYLIVGNVDGILNKVVGSIYVTNKREIGIFIFNKYIGKGYGKSAVLKVMEMWPNGRFYANVNPHNEASKRLFESIGGRVIQHTYVL